VKGNRDTCMNAPRALAFGSFRLIPERQLLLHGETPVRIGCRALDLLTVLVERPGVLVTKDELIAYAWPTTTVDQSNLKVNMGALRRALDDNAGAAKYIATVSGRGYRFVAPVEAVGPTGPVPSSPTDPPRTHNLPVGTTRIFGRADVIEAICCDLGQSRLVSIVGAGGIGKSTVAIAIAEQVAQSAAEGAWLVDLATVSDPKLAATAIATAVGLSDPSTDILAALCGFLRDRDMLIVLDNCEHVIDAVAICTTRILESAARIRILATSREPLLVKGERVRRLTGLDTPPAGAPVTALEALTFPAVQLFVERAADRLAAFELHDADAPAVADICRKLDGLALAIELAATRIDMFGVRGLVDQLDNRFRLLAGRRAAPERHRTLAATVDWSYNLLTHEEAALLRAVSVFAGSFDVDDAAAVAKTDPAQVTEDLVQLASKSLLAVDIDAGGVAYRLLETTRAYCLQWLQQDREEDPVTLSPPDRAALQGTAGADRPMRLCRVPSASGGEEN
jgi:predicted ATPase/DNA-binding winged helix-turn-helix (wHTH) protein